MNKLYYSGIEPCDVLNGDGFRTVIWVSGCSMGCKGCFNPSTHNPHYGQEYTQETEDYILECLSKDYIDGITITGGNPLEDYNLDTVLDLVNKIRLSLPEKTIWLYTGYEWEFIKDSFEESKKFLQASWKDNIIKRYKIVSQCDVLVDGRYVDSLRDINVCWRGSSNQRVINIKESIKQDKVVLHCD